MKKLLVVGLGAALLLGCVPQNNTYIQQDGFRQEKYEKPKPTIVNIPVNAVGIEWGKPVTGDNLMRRMGNHSIKGIDESKAEYGARMARVDGLSFSSVSYHVFEYDPDTEELSFSSADYNALARTAGLYSEDKDFKDMGNFMALGMIGGGSVEAGKYVGTNAFGATAVVSKTKSRGFKAVIGKKEGYQKARMDFDGSCKISPPEYRKHKNNLAIEYIAKLRYPYLSKGYNGSAPTISMPYDESEDIYYFRVDLLAARLVDSKTMQVFPCKMKYSLTET